MSVLPSRFSLYKRPNQIYYIGFYRDGRRHWKSTGATTKSGALKALAHFQELIREKARPIPLRVFAADFLAYAEKNYSPATFDIYRRCLRNFLCQIGDISLGNITAQHFDRYKTYRLGQVKPISVNIELRTLRAAFNTARKWKLIPQSPFEDVQFALVSEQLPVFFSLDGLGRLLACVEEQWFREVIVFAATTGLRRGEIANLRWVDVQMIKRIVLVHSTPTFKTKAEKHRTVPLNDAAMHVLASRIPVSLGKYVFTFDDKAIDPQYITHLFKWYVPKAGLDDRLHFHSLRHSFASLLVQSGSTLYEVQRLLGHSSSKVTEIYAHLQPEQLHSTVNRIQIELN